jgi:release factor glutamine methyltransferase
LNIRQSIAQLASDALPRAELRLLLSHVLSQNAAWLAAHDILGYREFYGRNFKCTPAALIPRPETELLIDIALTLVSARGEPVEPRILDVGTGTGCIAITLALEMPSAQVTALDISRDALTLARANAAALSANINFVESDWFSAIDASAQFDIIVSNPPYIVPNDPHLFQGDLRFEPWLALQDRGDGLQSYRELAAGAKQHLREGGLLIVEHGYDQGESVPALFREAGFEDVEMIRDLADQPRITRCKKQLLD